MKESQMSIGQKYAKFTANLCWSDIPRDVQEKTLDLVTDWIGNAAAGFDSRIGQALFSLVPGHQVSGRELKDGTVLLGNLQVVEPLQGALVNGGASHALEFDDAYRRGLYHPGAPVISAAWAGAGIGNTSGRSFLSSVAAGYEISMRLARAINPVHNKIFHTTGTVGTFGAAASASHCLGLNLPQTTGALGLAGTQASGLWEILPDFPQAKGLHAGKAAQSGLLGALLAKQGIWGPPGIFEGERGFFNGMVAGQTHLETCCEGLKDQWLLNETTIKAYPVCGHTMTAIEAALRLAKALDIEAIREIEIRAHPVSAGIAGNPAPKTDLQAKFSIAFCVAIALARGRVTLGEFSSETLSDPSIQCLLSKTRLVPDDDLCRDKGLRPARVSLKFSNGRILSETAKIRKGDPENPLTGGEIKRKFTQLVDPVWGQETGEKIFNAIRLLPRYENFNAWLNENILPWQNTHGFYIHSKEQHNLKRLK